MSSTKHTPGPWRIAFGPQYAHHTKIRVEAPESPDYKYGMVICEREYYTGVSDTVSKETMANFQKIAALPDLLAALATIAEGDAMAIMGSESFTMADVVLKYQRIAAQAIAKATHP